MTNAHHTIREATREDVPTILKLIRELATYEREPDAVIATEADLIRDGAFDSASARAAFHVLICEVPAEQGDEAREAVGFALYFFSYSTWRGRRCLYLEDLFVQPLQRGRGLGIAMMSALAKKALEEQCPRFVWQVLDWNQPSIDFYERLGAQVQREWLSVRLEGDALKQLAARSDH